MVTEALSYYSKGIKPHFISNIDPDLHQNILEKINPDTTIFIIVSKTFTTIETLENANKIRTWFINNASEDSIKDHFISISNNTEAPKKFGISLKIFFQYLNGLVEDFHYGVLLGLLFQ